MITNGMAQVLRNMTIPVDQTFAATVTLLPDSTVPTILSVAGCWWKPLDTRLDTYSGINLEGSERIINVPAEQINSGSPSGEARTEIRRRDRIAVNSVNYMVLSSGLRSVSSRWECLVREIET